MDTIFYWNIRGLKSNYEDLRLLLSQSNPAVVALQDCKLVKGQTFPRGYIPLLPPGESPGGEALLLLNNNIRFSPVELNTSLHAVAATISLDKTFTVVSIYLPPNNKVTKNSLETLFEQLPKPFLVLGDVNAHSPTWGDSRLDGRGRMLENLFHENNFIVLNSKEQTFIHSAYHTTSAIDLAVASPSIALDFKWAVHDDLCGSDHFPIFLTLTKNFNMSQNLLYNFKKADWSRFGDLCKSSIDDSILEMDCPAQTLTQKLTEAAKAAIPPYKNKKLVRVPWFGPDCRAAIQNRKKAQRKYFKNPNVENYINYKKEKAKCKFIIKQAKTTSWKEYVSKLNNNTSTKSVWKKIKKIKGKEITPNIHLKKNNTL